MSFRLSSWCKGKPSRLALETFLYQKGGMFCAYSEQQMYYSTESAYGGMMKTPQKVLTLKAADAIADHAINAVKNLQKPTPIVVTVMDPSGSVLVQKRMDGCVGKAYATFSYSKACTCINLQTSSRQFREKYTIDGEASGFTQAGTMVSTMNGELLPIAGGVLIRQRENQEGLSTIVGAVGVSGASADEDEYLALVGTKNAFQIPLESEDDGVIVTLPSKHSCTTLKE